MYQNNKLHYFVLAVAMLNISLLTQAVQSTSQVSECLKKLSQQQDDLQLRLLKRTEKLQNKLDFLWYGEHVFHLYRACANNANACKNFTEQEFQNAPTIFRQLVEKINALALAQEQIKKIAQQTEIQNDEIQTITDEALKKSRE